MAYRHIDWVNIGSGSHLFSIKPLPKPVLNYVPFQQELVKLKWKDKNFHFKKNSFENVIWNVSNFVQASIC